VVVTLFFQCILQQSQIQAHCHFNNNFIHLCCLDR
jgi:hypothetical protein